MPEGNILTSLLPLIVLFAIFYFLVIMPQQKQAKAHKAMLEAIKKGDKIITNGGLIGEVLSVEEDFIKLKLNDNIIVKLQRESVTKKIDEK